MPPLLIMVIRDNANLAECLEALTWLHRVPVADRAHGWHNMVDRATTRRDALIGTATLDQVDAELQTLGQQPEGQRDAAWHEASDAWLDRRRVLTGQ